MFCHLSTDINKQDGNKHRWSPLPGLRPVSPLTSSEARFSAEATITRPPVGGSAKVWRLLSLSHSQLKEKSNTWRRQRDGASTAPGHRRHRRCNAAISLACWQSPALSEEHLQLQDSHVQQPSCPQFSVDLEDCRSQNGWRSVQNADAFMGDAA